jgi:tryptophanyl-tRNA synthetase
MDIVLSGIRPTGNLHLGNYLGALRNFTKMQHENTCFFFIADYHSLTTHPTPQNLQGNVKQALVEYLAAELYLLMNMNAYMGELERVTTFKEKARKQPQNINAGLLTYPTLMAADILIHRAHKVPVGKDQEQHLEMTRTFARRFNRMYNAEVFPEPVAYNFGEDLVKIPGLDGSAKMSKSDDENSAIFLADEPEVIRKKVMRAVTDAGPTEKNSTKPEPIENLFTLMKAMCEPQTVQYFDEKYNSCEIRYGDLKKQLAEDMIRFTTPIREKIKELKANDAYLQKVMDIGKEKAHLSGATTIRLVREIIGFRPY